MKTQPFKFRYVNTIAGLFVILCAVLVIAGVLLAGRAQGWFEGRVRLIAEFTTAEGAYGLQEGSEIRILDAPAGRIQRIEPSDDGILQAELEIRQRFAELINRGSTAVVRRKIAGLAGDAYVDILPGKPGYEPFESGDTIAIERDVELVETVLNLVDNLQAQLIPLVDETRGILENVNRITGAIDAGEGPLGMMIHDQALADEIREIVMLARVTAETLPGLGQQVDDAMDQVQHTLTNVYRISETAEGMVSELAGEVQGVRGLLWEITETVRELGVVLRGVQNHWLLRKHVPGEPLPLIPMPSEMGERERRPSGP